MKLEASKARILLAEDNEINREVVMDILEPLHMEIDVAINGEEAVEMILAKPYDLVFMDYLMPVMDGAEATRVVRKTPGRDDLVNLPIVALTASSDETEKLLDAGMNDYIIKPISLQKATEKLARWLPKGMVYVVSGDLEEADDDMEYPKVEKVDIPAGINNCGSYRLLKKLFAEYANVIEWKASYIEGLINEDRADDFRIEVHALKSSSNLIGALEMSGMFEELEKLAKSGEFEKAKEKSTGVLREYRLFKDRLADYRVNQYANSVDASVERIERILRKMISDADCFFLDGMDADINELEKCKLPDDLIEDFDNLKVMVADVAMGRVLAQAKEMIKKLKA